MAPAMVELVAADDGQTHAFWLAGNRVGNTAYDSESGWAEPVNIFRNTRDDDYLHPLRTAVSSTHLLVSWTDLDDGLRYILAPLESRTWPAVREDAEIYSGVVALRGAQPVVASLLEQGHHSVIGIYYPGTVSSGPAHEPGLDRRRYSRSS
jgi:hypothetical protein